MEPYASECRKQEPDDCLNFDVLLVVILKLEQAFEIHRPILVKAIFNLRFPLNVVVVMAFAASCFDFILSLVVSLLSLSLIVLKLIKDV